MQKFYGKKIFTATVILAAVGLVAYAVLTDQEISARKKTALESLSGPPFVDASWLLDSLRPDNESASEGQAPGAPGLEAGLLLPDLKTRSMDKAYIEVDAVSGKKTLRFSSSNANVGSGPLEVKGVADKETNVIVATQRIYRSDGSFIEREIGRFVFHANHNHWHFENFIEFELYEYSEGGVLGKKAAETIKMTFCIFDTLPLPGDFAGRPQNGVYIKCESGTQGISAGWMDIYDADVFGQGLDITGLPDGRYAFRSKINPQNRIIEKTAENNVDLLFIEIAGDKVAILAGP